MKEQKNTFWVFTVILALGLIYFSACTKSSKISIQVVSVQSGEFYEADPPKSDQKIFWISGDARIGDEQLNLVLENGAKGWTTSPDQLLVRTEGGLIGRLKTDNAKNIFVTEVTNFIPFDDNPGQEQEGEFWQIVLGLKNSEPASSTLWLHNRKENGLNIKLLPQGGKEVEPTAFLVPNLRLGKIALLTKWQGKLGIRLAPGDKTWLLLLFDVPKETKEAVLTLGDTKLNVKPEKGPYGNLVAHRLVRAGSAVIQILSVSEGEKIPLNKKKAKKPENRFVFVEMNVAACASDSPIRTIDLLLATQKGEKFDKPNFLGKTILWNEEAVVEGVDGAIANMSKGSTFTLFFEVPKTIPLSDLKLVHQVVHSLEE